MADYWTFEFEEDRMNAKLDLSAFVADTLRKLVEIEDAQIEAMIVPWLESRGWDVTKRG